MLGARLPQAALPMVPGPPCLPGDARLGGGGLRWPRSCLQHGIARALSNAPLEVKCVLQIP